jgi:UDP-glucose 4-epimerase
MVVTGGAGFIGSHLSEKLIEMGCRVRVIDNLSQGKREWVPEEAEFFEGDILEKNLLRKVFIGASGVFHIAAMSKVAPSIDTPEFCTEQNVLGTQNVLMAAKNAEVKKLVYSSSSTYYGNRESPQYEDMLPNPLNPYALSKYVGEQYCELWTRLYGLPTISLRYFNVYGPRQPKEGAYALVLGIFLRQKKNGEPLTIHGDGFQKRDFVHVRDVVKANILAFKSDVSGIALNVGSGTNVSVKELADNISKNQIFEPRRKGDAEITLADISKIKKILGWKPKIKMKEGLEELTS